MAFVNSDFSEEGLSRGLPLAWTVVSLVRAQRLAAFGIAPPYESVETFEGWTQLLLQLGVVEQAFFDARPEAFEDFAEGWSVDFYAFAFQDVGVESTTFAGDVVERFAAGWQVDAFAWALTDDATVRAKFTTASAEGFERGHRNDNYRLRFSDGQLERASLSGAAVETFETTWPAHDTRGGGHHGE